ncbi:hypothetical protein ACFE04_014690 [Oxalis oulophora]
MDSASACTACHVVAVPYPGRGHVNPMMNLCKLLASKNTDILITLVVTEEWLGLISSYRKPENITFATIPNVLPSELVRGNNFPGFYAAVMSKMEVPFEKLLDKLEPPIAYIIADMELMWAIPVGNCRNIPVASLCTMSASALSIISHPALHQHRDALIKFLDNGEELLTNIPGISTTNVTDLQMIFYEEDPFVLSLVLEFISRLPKAKYLLINSVYEIEQQAVDTLREIFDLLIFPIGPAIPYFELEQNSSSTGNTYYLEWLDSQPKSSVLYVSLGSFLSVSSDQMNELSAGLQSSGVRYLWVARGELACLNETGLVVPWCDQLKVLCHPSVGGFWTHCGWNSTLEAVFAGVPMLTFPINYDQCPNSKKVVEEWKIGSRVKNRFESASIVKREEIVELVQNFMDLESKRVNDMRNRAAGLQEICKQAVAQDGSSQTNIMLFMNDMLTRKADV